MWGHDVGKLGYKQSVVKVLNISGNACPAVLCRVRQTKVYTLICNNNPIYFVKG